MFFFAYQIKTPTTENQSYFRFVYSEKALLHCLSCQRCDQCWYNPINCIHRPFMINAKKRACLSLFLFQSRSNIYFCFGYWYGSSIANYSQLLVHNDNDQTWSQTNIIFSSELDLVFSTFLRESSLLLGERNVVIVQPKRRDAMHFLCKKADYYNAVCDAHKAKGKR